MRGGLDVVIGEGMNAFDLRLEGIALGRFAENNRQKLFDAMVEFVPFLGADLDQPLQAFRGEGGYRFRGCSLSIFTMDYHGLKGNTLV